MTETWAHDMVDLHVHSSPSLLPRHRDDAEAVRSANAAGFATVVLKAHEGSTAARAANAGMGAVGGIVLNSPVGGANPDAVAVAAGLGARVVWAPTVSARAHRHASGNSELAVHQTLSFSEVPVLDDTGGLLKEWQEVLEVVVAHDMVLASGHLHIEETLILFGAARRAGVTRLLVNHPLMSFVGWHLDHVNRLTDLEVMLELGILPDLLTGTAPSSISLARSYPTTLLAFGSDLGHADYPDHQSAVADWLGRLESEVGSAEARRIMTNGGHLLS